VVERADVYVNGMDYASYERLRGQRVSRGVSGAGALGDAVSRRVVERVARALAREAGVDGPDARLGPWMRREFGGRGGGTMLRAREPGVRVWYR